MPYEGKTEAFTLSFEGREGWRGSRRARLQPGLFVRDRVCADYAATGANAELPPRSTFRGCPTLAVGGWVLGFPSSHGSAASGSDRVRNARPGRIPEGKSRQKPPFQIATDAFLIETALRLEIAATDTKQRAANVSTQE